MLSSNPVSWTLSGKANSFSECCLQVIDGVEVLTTNKLLDCYKHVWCNPHWYDSVEFLYPQIDSNIVKPTVQQIKGAKRIQSALIHYIYRPPKDGSTDSNETSLIMSSIFDICKRLLDSKESPVPLQAIIETKQILAIISSTNVYLLKSPRTLRTLLWKLKLKFASVYGHSADPSPNVNLPAEDLETLTDSKSNFPGCVKWKQLVENNHFPIETHACLDRWRDILWFEGVSETEAFLKVFSDLTNNGTTTNDKSSVNSKNDSENLLSKINFKTSFDLSQTKRILTNFPFRGGQLETSKLLWSTVSKTGLCSIKLECSLVPAAQNEFVRGVSQLVDLDKFTVRFRLSSNYDDLWNLFKTSRANEDVRANCFGIMQWLSKHGPVETVEQGKPRSRQSLPCDIIQSNAEAAVYSLSRCISNPSSDSHQFGNAAFAGSKPFKSPSAYSEGESTTTPNTDSTTIATPTVCSVDSLWNRSTSFHFKVELSVESQQNLTRNESAKKSSLVRSAVESSDTAGCNGDCNSVPAVVATDDSLLQFDEVTPVLKKPLRPKIVIKESKRVGPAPMLRSKKSALRLKNVSLVKSPSSVASEALQLELYSDPLEVLPPKYSKALCKVNNNTALFIGDFILSPLTTSVPMDVVLNDQLCRAIAGSTQVAYLILSSMTSRRHLADLLETPDCARKLRSFYWYSRTWQLSELSKAAAHTSAEESLHTTPQIKPTDVLNLAEDSLMKCLSPYVVVIDDAAAVENSRLIVSAAETHEQFKTSRNVFFIVTDLGLADLVSPLTTKPQSRVLLNANARSLSNWIFQMDSKQKIWETEATKHLHKHNDDARIKETLLKSCPNFQVHVIAVLPEFLEFPLTEKSLHCFNEAVHANVHWSTILSNLNDVKTIQKQFICSVPLDAHKQMYRLNLWTLPLNYIEKCYRNQRLVEGAEMLELALKYDGSKFVPYKEDSLQGASEPVPKDSLEEVETYTETQETLVEQNTKSYPKKAVLINEELSLSKREILSKSTDAGAGSAAKRTSKKPPPASDFMPFRAYLKAVNNRMKKALFENKKSIINQISSRQQTRETKEKRSSEIPQKTEPLFAAHPTQASKPTTLRYSEPPMYSENDSKYVKPSQQTPHAVHIAATTCKPITTATKSVFVNTKSARPPPGNIKLMDHRVETSVRAADSSEGGSTSVPRDVDSVAVVHRRTTRRTKRRNSLSEENTSQQLRHAIRNSSSNNSRLLHKDHKAPKNNSNVSKEYLLAGSQTGSGIPSQQLHYTDSGDKKSSHQKSTFVVNRLNNTLSLHTTTASSISINDSVNEMINY